jgi:uncharacterized protein (TIGR00251 family)
VSGEPIDQLDLTPVPGGVRLRLRVKPGARKDALLGVHGGALKLCVTEAPERGRANEAVLVFLARVFDVPRAILEISSGSGSRDKVVFVPLGPEPLRERIRRLFSPRNT